MLAGHYALDFINTLEGRFHPKGPREYIKTYSELVRFAERANGMTPWVADHLVREIGLRSGEHILKCAKTMREHFAEGCYARVQGKYPARETVDGISHSLTNSIEMVEWIPQNRILTRRHWSWIRGMDKGAEIPLSTLAGVILDFVKYADLTKMKMCENEQCKKLFLDKSKNHRRRWCEMSRCGSRAKAVKSKAVRPD
jgi:predicted RNA-binding Zn ribbon-like protein